MGKALRVAVTGASGFIGRRLCDELVDARFDVTAISRRSISASRSVRLCVVEDLDSSPNWDAALSGIDVVVHCAGVAHEKFSSEKEAIDRYDLVNRVGTVELVQAAIRASVGRFIFISTIGVYGKIGRDQRAHESLLCVPIEHYAASKFAAENEVLTMTQNSAMEVVIVRPPMVYGPEDVGNFFNLVSLVKRGIPLPFKGLSGIRNFVALDNLTDFLVMVCSFDGVASGVFNVCDNEELNLPEMVGLIGKGLGVRVVIFNVPFKFLRALLSIFGMQSIVEKLNTDVRVSNCKAKSRFGWSPSVCARDGIIESACSFRKNVEG